MTVHAAALEHTFVMHVVLPRDYDVVVDRVFPVVFLNDGQNQFTDRGMWGGWHTDSTATADACRSDAGYCARGRGDAPQSQPRLSAEGMHGHRKGKLRTTPTSSLTRYYRSFVALPCGVRSWDDGHCRLVKRGIHALFAGCIGQTSAFGCLSYARLQPEQNRPGTPHQCAAACTWIPARWEK